MSTKADQFLHLACQGDGSPPCPPPSLTPLPRPVTSLVHQVGRSVFWERPKFFKLCPIHFSRWGEKNFNALPPWLRAWAYRRLKWHYTKNQVASIKSGTW